MALIYMEMVLYSAMELIQTGPNFIHIFHLDSNMEGTAKLSLSYDVFSELSQHLPSANNTNVSK